MRVRKAVIPAAGLGTRFLPATKALPKEMIPIVDKPAIQYIIEEIVDSGIEDILVITGRGKRAIVEHFDKSVELNVNLRNKGQDEVLRTLEKIEQLADIHYVQQKESLGTGHAVLKAASHIGDEPFAVLFGDDLIQGPEPGLKEMIRTFEKYNSTVLGVSRVTENKVSDYGIIKGKPINGEFLVEDLVEKPSIGNAPSDMALIGRMIFTADIFDYLRKTKINEERKEILLTDAILAMAKEKVVYAHVLKGKWHTVGDKLSFIKTTIEYALVQKDLRKGLKEYLKELKL
ncbi:MAG: UTP--glucose-1-phosphate uridylyltransferase GalU [Candidatus Glassbacteria bacterium]|nr:UTP--glucose-1-phosphate uridylyltransferase GalU [Candidatus Glassbacteria bacterium]